MPYSGQATPEVSCILRMLLLHARVCVCVAAASVLNKGVLELLSACTIQGHKIV